MISTRWILKYLAGSQRVNGSYHWTFLLVCILRDRRSTTPRRLFALDFVKLILYTAFFCVLFRFYGLPIHIMRDWFMTTRSLLKRARCLVRYRQALKDMDQYPDASSEDPREREHLHYLQRGDAVPGTRTKARVERTRPKKLPRGHILHFGCLKSWLERQQVCPTCRTPVVRERQPPARNGDALVFRFGLNMPGGQNHQPAPPANGQAPRDDQAGQIDGGQNNQNNQNNRNNAVRMFNPGPLRLGFCSRREPKISRRWPNVWACLQM